MDLGQKDPKSVTFTLCIIPILFSEADRHPLDGNKHSHQYLGTHILSAPPEKNISISSGGLAGPSPLTKSRVYTYSLY